MSEGKLGKIYGIAIAMKTQQYNNSIYLPTRRHIHSGTLNGVQT